MMTPEDCIISQSDFDTFVADQIAFLKCQLNGRPKSLMPHLAVTTKDMEGKVGLIVSALAVPFSEDAEKRSVLAMCGRKTYEQKVIPLAIALTSEAWIARVPKIGPHPEARHCANRREVACVFAQSMGKEHVTMASFPVRRDASNRMEVIEDTEPESVMRGMRLPLLDHFFRGFRAATMAQILGRS